MSPRFHSGDRGHSKRRCADISSAFDLEAERSADGETADITVLDSRRQLSSNSTMWHRRWFPIVLGVVGAVLLASQWRGSLSGIAWPLAIYIGALAYSVWLGHRLFDVWLVGDTVEVSGPAIFRVALLM